LTAFTQAQDFDAKTREAIGKVMQLQQSVAEAEQRLRQADTARKEIVDEQGRLRENLGKVPANSDLQRRYLATLDKQETDLEGIAKRKADAQKAVDAAREALRTYIAQLG
jgi:chromosome segregation ATPase